TEKPSKKQQGVNLWLQSKYGKPFRKIASLRKLSNANNVSTEKPSKKQQGVNLWLQSKSGKPFGKIASLRKLSNANNVSTEKPSKKQQGVNLWLQSKYGKPFGKIASLRKLSNANNVSAEKPSKKQQGVNLWLQSKYGKTFGKIGSLGKLWNDSSVSTEKPSKEKQGINIWQQSKYGKSFGKIGSVGKLWSDSNVSTEKPSKEKQGINIWQQSKYGKSFGKIGSVGKLWSDSNVSTEKPSKEKQGINIWQQSKYGKSFGKIGSVGKLWSDSNVSTEKPSKEKQGINVWQQSKYGKPFGKIGSLGKLWNDSNVSTEKPLKENQGINIWQQSKYGKPFGKIGSLGKLWNDSSVSRETPSKEKQGINIWQQSTYGKTFEKIDSLGKLSKETPEDNQLKTASRTKGERPQGKTARREATKKGATENGTRVDLSMNNGRETSASTVVKEKQSKKDLSQKRATLRTPGRLGHLLEPSREKLLKGTAKEKQLGSATKRSTSASLGRRKQKELLSVTMFNSKETLEGKQGSTTRSPLEKKSRKSITASAGRRKQKGPLSKMPSRVWLTAKSLPEKRQGKRISPVLLRTGLPSQKMNSRKLQNSPEKGPRRPTIVPLRRRERKEFLSQRMPLRGSPSKRSQPEKGSGKTRPTAAPGGRLSKELSPRGLPPSVPNRRTDIRKHTITRTRSPWNAKNTEKKPTRSNANRKSDILITGRNAWHSHGSKVNVIATRRDSAWNGFGKSTRNAFEFAGNYARINKKKASGKDAFGTSTSSNYSKEHLGWNNKSRKNTRNALRKNGVSGNAMNTKNAVGRGAFENTRTLPGTMEIYNRKAARPAIRRNPGSADRLRKNSSTRGNLARNGRKNAPFGRWKNNYRMNFNYSPGKAMKMYGRKAAWPRNPNKADRLRKNSSTKGNLAQNNRKNTWKNNYGIKYSNTPRKAMEMYGRKAAWSRNPNEAARLRKSSSTRGNFERNNRKKNTPFRKGRTNYRLNSSNTPGKAMKMYGRKAAWPRNPNEAARLRKSSSTRGNFERNNRKKNTPFRKGRTNYRLNSSNTPGKAMKMYGRKAAWPRNPNEAARLRKSSSIRGNFERNNRKKNTPFRKGRTNYRLNSSNTPGKAMKMYGRKAAWPRNPNKADRLRKNSSTRENFARINRKKNTPFRKGRNNYRLNSSNTPGKDMKMYGRKSSWPAIRRYLRNANRLKNNSSTKMTSTWNGGRKITPSRKRKNNSTLKPRNVPGTRSAARRSRRQ
ncbi:unnamed protein product, partial [Cylicocyclus nassatus]